MSDIDPSLNFDFEVDTTTHGEPMDATLSVNIRTSNNPQEDVLQEDHGLVDAHDFKQLQD